MFNSAASGASGSLESAFKGNADGTTRANLEKIAKAFGEVTEQFSAEVKSIAVAMRNDATRKKIDISRFSKLSGKTLEATEELWQASATELDRLLIVRISDFKARLWTMLGISGAVTLAAIALAFFLVRQITGPWLKFATRWMRWLTISSISILAAWGGKTRSAKSSVPRSN